jgi:hypothetical protein
VKDSDIIAAIAPDAVSLMDKAIAEIKRLRQENATLTAERDEARKEAESWQDDALRMMRDRNTAERERDEAQRECCVRTVDAGGNPAHAPLKEAIAEAKRRGWKCYRTAEDA